MLLSIFVVSLVFLAISRIIKSRNYWKVRHVLHKKPLPLTGNHIQFSLGLKPFATVVQEWYEEFKDKRFNGIFLNNRPALLLRDSQLIAECATLEHANPTIRSIRDHALTYPNKHAGGNTSELDLNVIHERADRASNHFVDYFLGKGNSAMAIDAEHMVERYVADVLRSLLYKGELNLFQKHNDREFRVISDGLKKSGDEVNTLAGLKEIVKTKISNPNKDAEVRKLVHQLMMDNRNEILQQIGQSNGDEYVVALFKRIFQNVASTTTFLTYELTVNTTLCTALQKEIDAAYSNNNKITIEDISKMTYLDSLIKETLRKWPTSVVDFKQCNKELEIGCNEKCEPLTLDKNSLIVIPTYALHRDANHYLDPDQFDPYRNEDNKTVDVYRTLGNNKTCVIWSILISKVFMVNMMKQFSLVPISKTRIPLELSTRSCKIESKHGIWVGLQRRRRVSTIVNEIYY